MEKVKQKVKMSNKFYLVVYTKEGENIVRRSSFFGMNTWLDVEMCLFEQVGRVCVNFVYMEELPDNYMKAILNSDWLQGEDHFDWLQRFKAALSKPQNMGNLKKDLNNN